MFLKPGLLTNRAERALHRHGIRADVRGGGYGEEIDVVVGFDEVGAGHDLACYVQGDLGDVVGAVVLGGGVLVVGFGGAEGGG